MLLRVQWEMPDWKNIESQIMFPIYVSLLASPQSACAYFACGSFTHPAQTLTGSLGDRVDAVIKELRVGSRVRVHGRLQSQEEATSNPRGDMMDLIVHDVVFLPSTASGRAMCWCCRRWTAGKKIFRRRATPSD
jgi:hypothetical protein